MTTTSSTSWEWPPLKLPGTECSSTSSLSPGRLMTYISPRASAWTCSMLGVKLSKGASLPATKLTCVGCRLSFQVCVQNGMDNPIWHSVEVEAQVLDFWLRGCGIAPQADVRPHL